MSNLQTLLEKLRALDEASHFKNMPLRVHSIENAKTILTAIPLLLEIIEKQREALEGILKSEALKEAPFYNYCESISKANDVIKECDQIAARII